MAGDAVTQIKDRLSIVDVVAPYVELHQAGKNMKGKSPFTNEKTPSFYVSPDRGMYYCFSSSQGGDIFTFIQEMEGVDFKGALKILADKAGVELAPEDPKKKTARDRQYDLLEAATSWFETRLQDHKTAYQYLTDRGVAAKTIAAWRLGYAPGPPQFGWRDGKDFLEGKGYSKEELGKAGLIKGFDTGKEPYDVFRDRVMFPIFDSAGKVVAYSGRLLTKDSEAPKYVNSPETELFNKSEILYGYHAAKQGIRQYDFSLIVEGQFDVVLCHQSGYTNTVAVSGTALTPHHVMLLQRLSNRVVLALDSDRAGIAAVKRAAELMLARGMDVKVVLMPEGEDPADIIGRDAGEFKTMVGQSQHVIEYLLDILKRSGGDERTFKLKAREEILPYVARIPNKIDQEHFEGLIADRLETTKDAIHFEVERLQSEAPPAAPVETEAPTEAVSHERETEVRNYLAVMAQVIPTALQGPVREQFAAVTGEQLDEVHGALEADVQSQLTFTLEAQLGDMPDHQLRSDLVDRLNELNVSLRKTELAEAKVALQAAEHDGQSDTTELLTTITTIQKRLSEPALTVAIFGE